MKVISAIETAKSRRNISLWNRSLLNSAMLIVSDYLFRVCVIAVINAWKRWVKILRISFNRAGRLTIFLLLDLEFKNFSYTFLFHYFIPSFLCPMFSTTTDVVTNFNTLIFISIIQDAYCFLLSKDSSNLVYVVGFSLITTLFVQTA